MCCQLLWICPLWNISSRNVPIFIDLFVFLLLIYRILIYIGQVSCIRCMGCKYFFLSMAGNLLMVSLAKQKFNFDEVNLYFFSSI